MSEEYIERTSGLSQYVKNIFEEFRQARLPYEEVWKECWYNFLGQYQPELVWRKKTEGTKGRSRIFIKLTTVKCHTAHSKISDVLFSGRNVMPFDVEVLEPEMFGVPLEVVQEAEKRMKERLRDHFKRIRLKKKMDVAVLEMAVFGTAVLKGPIVRVEKRPAVRLKTISNIPVTEFDRSLSPYEMVMVDEIVPDIERVPVWNYFVDPNARTNRDSIAEIHFERMNPTRFRMLASMRGVSAEAVEIAAERATTTTEDEELRYVQLGENYAGEFGEKDRRVSVLEYWGLVPVKHLREAGCDVPERYRDGESVEAKVVLAADGVVIKACVNHLGIRPFFVCPWKERPGQIYGCGVAEAMRDSQKMVNSAARMIIDNKAMSGNGMIAINLDRINTKRTKNLEVYPGKTWYIKGNFSPREVVDSVKFDDVTYGLRELMEMFERFADEETGIPKYTHGLQGSFLNKMLDINTPVPMADGTYKRLEDIRDGDRIIGSNGKPTTVVRAHPIQYPKRAYEIEFKSGDVIVAGGEHLWTIQTQNMREWKTINTDELYERFRKYKTRIFIPRVQRPDFDGADELPLNPYVLGVWLGNGHLDGARVTMPDDEGVMRYLEAWCEDNGYRLILDSYQNGGKSKTYTISACKTCRNSKGQFSENGSFYSILKSLGLVKGQKHIPEVYFRASYNDRLQLLRGLMDTDGCHHSGSLVVFTQKEGRLLDDVVKLIVSLGGFPRISEIYPKYEWKKEGSRYYQVRFSLVDNPFGFSRKAMKWRPSPHIHRRQKIVSMREVEIRPMRCLTVDAEDGLYAVGERFTLTHNTATGMSMLMTQANINLKTVIENIDDYWIEPVVEAFGQWFQDFGDDPLLRMPFRYKATGTDSMIAKEIKMENYMKFLQITSNPQDAIFMDRVKLMKAIARILETEDVMRSDEEIEKLLQQMGQLAESPADLRQRVSIEKLYPMLTRAEQIQILKQIGIEPDEEVAGNTPMPAPQDETGMSPPIPPEGQALAYSAEEVRG